VRGRSIVSAKRDEGIGGIAKFAHVHVIEFGIVLGATGNRRAAERRDATVQVGPTIDIVDLRLLICMPLTKTASAQVKSAARATDVLIDEPHVPIRRHVVRDDQDALRRHERFHPDEGIGVLERAERGRVMRKHAQDIARHVCSARFIAGPGGAGPGRKVDASLAERRFGT
jgi:hypothetical protein